MKFLGIDLGWSSGASGLCCLDWHEERLRLLDLQCLMQMDEILGWIDRWVTPSEAAVIAVDAPTLIPNATGMRLCDRLTHKHFGRYHAGCYPANLGRPFAQRTVAFGLSLEARGFMHAPVITPQEVRRHQIEVFPHPAMIHLFGLPQILKYKRGRVGERRLELLRLRQMIGDRLSQHKPLLDLGYSPQPLPEIPLTGVAIKRVEDQLDSLICAYVAAHWWYWGLERNWVLGDRATGYIVVPAPRG